MEMWACPNFVYLSLYMEGSLKQKEGSGRRLCAVCLSVFGIVRTLTISSLLFLACLLYKFVHEPEDMILYLLTGSKRVYYVLLLLF